MPCEGKKNEVRTRTYFSSLQTRGLGCDVEPRRSRVSRPSKRLECVGGRRGLNQKTVALILPLEEQWLAGVDGLEGNRAAVDSDLRPVNDADDHGTLQNARGRCATAEENVSIPD